MTRATLVEKHIICTTEKILISTWYYLVAYKKQKHVIREKKLIAKGVLLLETFFATSCYQKKLFEKCVVEGRAEVVFSKRKVLPF